MLLLVLLPCNAILCYYIQFAFSPISTHPSGCAMGWGCLLYTALLWQVALCCNTNCPDLFTLLLDTSQKWLQCIYLYILQLLVGLEPIWGHLSAIHGHLCLFVIIQNTDCCKPWCIDWITKELQTCLRPFHFSQGR